MCGRYVIDDGLNGALAQLGYQYEAPRTKEIFPTNTVPLLTGSGLVQSFWGFPKWSGKGVIINARAETVHQKKMFSAAFNNGRCVVPSSGFYEWQGKDKFLFKVHERPALFMAGLCKIYDGGISFVILTTMANSSVKDIHSRMPLVLPEQDITKWLEDEQAAVDMIDREPPNLRHELV